MDRIARASAGERSLVFEAAAQRMALAPAVVEKELMVAWVDRDTYMERLWALEGTRGIKVITGARRFVNVNPSFTDSTNAIAQIAPTHPRRFRRRQAPFPASRSGARPFVR